jgi:hypothetical protein
LEFPLRFCDCENLSSCHNLNYYLSDIARTRLPGALTVPWIRLTLSIRRWRGFKGVQGEVEDCIESSVET